MPDCDLSVDRLQRLTADYLSWQAAVEALRTADGRNWHTLQQATRHLNKARAKLEYFRRWASGQGPAQRLANQRRRRAEYRRRKEV